MRTILFRGQKADTNQWIQGDLIYEIHGGVAIETPSIHHRENNESTGSFTRVKAETVGQFTEMKDKFNSGKNIFDGDIFKHGSKNNVYGVVRLHLGEWIVNFENYQIPLYQFLMNDTERETCGNIHDNPELPVFF